MTRARGPVGRDPPLSRHSFINTLDCGCPKSLMQPAGLQLSHKHAHVRTIYAITYLHPAE